MSATGHDLLSEAELRALLERDEGQFLEFKSLWDQGPPAPPRPLGRRQARDFVAECVAAFANADGGTLILGVEDDGTPTGHSYPEDAIADLQAVPERRLRPTVTCRFQRITIDGHEVLIAQAPMAPGRGAVYRVAPDLHEARAFLEARIPALRAHFARKAELKNADYREIFSVTRYAASRELRRLVEEGILRLEGERRGAKYLPGPVLGAARAV